MRKKALRAALPCTIPVLVGFLFLGASYGFLMRSKGFTFFWPVAMSVLVFAGSMQFVAVPLLLADFDPIRALLLTLMVNARHLFYGVSMLGRYQGMGWKKPYLIFGMCDETFSINCSATVPPGVDRGWFLFFVTLLDHGYWVLGTILGAILGSLVQFDTQGIEFVMTALFVVIFLNQWEETADHRSALTGVFCSVLCLFLFGSGNFLLPAMGLIILCFSLGRGKGGKGAAE